MLQGKATHPDPLALLRHVCEAPDPAVTRHLAQCPSCARHARQLQDSRSALRLRAAAGQAGPECLGEDSLAALAEGNRDEQAMLHLADCAHCRSSLASLMRVLADPAVVSAAAATARRRSRRWPRVAVPAAAAAVLLIAVLGRTGRQSAPAPVHREPAITALDQPKAISPLGISGRPESLRWAAVPGADRYRMTLFHSDGRVLYSVELRDTATGLPDSIQLAPGSSYLWMVEARRGWDRWSSSPLFEFSLGQEPAR